MSNQDRCISTTTQIIIEYAEGLMIPTDDKEIIISTMEIFEDVRFIMLVMKPSYRIHLTPYIIVYCDIMHNNGANR